MILKWSFTLEVMSTLNFSTLQIPVGSGGSRISKRRGTNSREGCANLLLPPANEVWGKVIFLHLCVILFTGGVPGQVPPGRYTPRAGTRPGRYTPWQVHPHRQVHPPGRYTPPRQVHPWQVHTPPTVHAGIRSTSGRYASYWNAFLFCNFFAENYMKMKEFGPGASLDPPLVGILC